MPKHSASVILFLVFLLLPGCTTPQLPQSQATAVLAPSPSPLPANTLQPVTQAQDFPVVRIKNAATGTYLTETDGVATLVDNPASNETALWILEDYQGSKRIQNQASGYYLSIEHLKEFVEVIPIYPEWTSPQWTIEGDPTNGAIVLRNVWHNWQVLFHDDGQVSYARVPTITDHARWFLEPLTDSIISASKPIPVVTIPPATNPIDSRGVAVPWVEYEAEMGETNGEILTAERTFGTFATESSGRSAVQLDETGEYVEFAVKDAANSVVVRFVIPDSEDGTGQEATISLYVNAVFRQKIPLTSRYAWSYGGEEWTFNTPQAGGAHHFYDEARALVGDIPANASIRLQKDADDSAAYYVIDLVDLEQVAPPRTQPEGSLSIVQDCGAIPDDGEDDGDAIQTCVRRAKAAKTAVWIPSGTFESNIRGFNVSDVTIQGAGMWYSTIHGSFARFNCIGNGCRYFDFAILGETILRDDKSPENGFNGGAGSGSRLENIWVEHTKVGYWVGGASNGLVITGSRFRNLFADGVNFCNGTSNSVIENSHFRNTGDDALASWSPQGSGVNTGNVFRFNTVQIPWRANCFAIYGGADNTIENNLCTDVVTYPGILVAQQFNSNPFAGTTTIQHNSLIRAGGPMFHSEHGALKIWAAQGEISGLVVKDLLIDNATFTGIQLEGPYPITSATFADIEIMNAGTNGIYLSSNLAGDATFSATTIQNSGAEALLNYAPKLHFSLHLGEANQGW